MKRAISVVLALLFVFAITSISLAVEEKAVPAEKPKVKQVTGEVKVVDTKAKTVTVTKTVKGKAEETTVTVDDKTKIMRDKESKTLADVKVGDKVTVKYKEVEGKNIAKSIAIKPAEKKTEPSVPAKK